MKPGDVLTTIDADIAGTQGRLQQLQTLRANLVALYGDQAAGEQPTPAPEPRAKSGRNAAASAAAAGGRQKQREEAKELVLTWLSKRSAPATLGEIVAGTKVSMFRVQGAVDALAAADAVVRRGKTSQTRIGVPSVMARAAKEGL